MKRHELKIDPELFKAVRSKIKTAEVRFNDKDYQVGDVLILFPFCRVANKRVHPDFVCREVTHIVEGGNYGIESGYCLLSMKEI